MPIIDENSINCLLFKNLDDRVDEDDLIVRKNAFDFASVNEMLLRNQRYSYLRSLTLDEDTFNEAIKRLNSSRASAFYESLTEMLVVFVANIRMRFCCYSDFLKS